LSKAPHIQGAPVAVTRGELWLRCGRSAQELDAAGFLRFLRRRPPVAHESLADLRNHVDAFPETDVTMPAATFDARGLALLRTSASTVDVALAEVAAWRRAGYLLHGAVLPDQRGRSRIILDPGDGFEAAVEEVRVFSLTDNKPLDEVPHRILRFGDRSVDAAIDAMAERDATASAIVKTVLAEHRPTTAEIEEIGRSYARRLEDEGLNPLLRFHMLLALRSLRPPRTTSGGHHYGYNPNFQFGEPYDSAGGAYARLPRRG
jgi:hypothetical protein